ncbi:MAG: phage tail protein [Bacillota bacterium]
MAEPFIGEIRAFSFDFEPHGWAFCDGRLLSIAQNTALFSILGTTYGGDGRTTFGLPDLRGRAPVHVGDTVRLGQASGEETHTLSVAELAAHTHGAAASKAAAQLPSPAGNLWADLSHAYGTSHNAEMHPSAIGQTGAGEAHENMQPYLATNFCIALVGIFPPRD